MNTIWIVIPILTILMFDLGLALDVRGFGVLVRRPAPIIVGLVGQLLLLPALAFALGWGFGLEPIFFLGLVLIACSPGGSSSNIFSMVAGGDVPLSVLLTALSSILTLFTIPVIMRLAVGVVGGEDATLIDLPVGALIVQNILLVLLPVMAGVVLRRLRLTLAEAIHSRLSRIAMPALLLLAVVFFSQHYATIFEQIGRLGACIAALILLAMGGGWLLSRAVGFNGMIRRTLVIEIGMQNAAQAIAIATSPFVFASEAMAVPAIVYALLMNVILLTYISLLRRGGGLIKKC